MFGNNPVLDEFSRIMNQASSEIMKLNEQDIPHIEESEFRTNWILTLYDYIQGKEVQIGLWLQRNDISPFTEVIVDDENGNELFRVPSILIPANQVIPPEVSIYLGDLAKRAEIQDKSIPGMGTRFFEQEVTNKLIDHSESVNMYRMHWDSIFARYGLQPVFFPAVQPIVGEYNQQGIGYQTSDEYGDFEDEDTLD